MPRSHLHPVALVAETLAPGPGRPSLAAPPAISKLAWRDQPPATLIDVIYDAALDPRKWIALLSRFIDDLDCSGASFCIQDSDPSAIQQLIAVQRSADGDGLRRYHYAAPYLLWDEGEAARPWNPAAARLAVVQSAFLEKSEPYDDLLASQRAGRRFDVLRLADQGSITSLTLFRNDGMEYFGTAERQYLDLLKPHLRRAARLSLTLADLRGKRRAQMAVLDRLPFGTLVLDCQGRVLLMNRGAKGILSKTEALKIKLGRLTGARAKDMGQLKKFFGRCTRERALAAPCRHELLSFSDLTGRNSVSLLLAPVDLTDGLDATGATVTGFLFDSDHRPKVCRPTLVRLYQLTGAESRLVEALVAGETLETAAGRFGVSKQTLRKQLGTIYQKTGTHRQAELMSLVLSGPAIIEQIVSG